MTSEVYSPSTPTLIDSTVTPDELHESTVTESFDASMEMINAIVHTTEPSLFTRESIIHETLYNTPIEKGLYYTDNSHIVASTEDQINSDNQGADVSILHKDSTVFIKNDGQEHQTEVMTESTFTQSIIPIKTFQDPSQDSSPQKSSTIQTGTPTSPFLTISVQVNTDILSFYKYDYNSDSNMTSVLFIFSCFHLYIRRYMIF